MKPQDTSVRSLYLIRHAEVDVTYRGRYLGTTDVALSSEGRDAARKLGQKLEGVLQSAPVWMSPLLRCRETWSAMAIRDTQPVMIEHDLREIDFGHWETRNFDEIVASHPLDVERWNEFHPSFRFPGGESLETFLCRMRALQMRITEANEPSLVCVTHGGVIATLICLFLGIDPSRYLAFRMSRPSVASLAIYGNGLGTLTGLNLSDLPTGKPRPL